MGDLGVEDQNAALAPQSCTATRTQRQDQGSSVCRACCPSTLWTGRWGAPCWYLAATRSKQGFSIVTLTGLVSLAGTSVCLDQATLSRVENVLCHCSPATSCSGTQDWCTLAALVLVELRSLPATLRAPPSACAWGRETRRLQRFWGEGGCRGRGLVLLALALAGQWHQGAAQSEGEEHFQTGGADRRTKTIDLMSCKAHVAKLSDCSYL